MDLTRAGRERREYPEVSYSVIGALVTGLMGIRVETTLPLTDMLAGKPFATAIVTLPQLTSKTGWAELRNLPVQGKVITVRHEGNRSTRLTNRGKSALHWKATFPGSFETLLVDGKPRKAHIDPNHFGHTVTWIMWAVPAGSTVEVQAPK
jgi:hypothetical protein